MPELTDYPEGPAEGLTDRDSSPSDSDCVGSEREPAPVARIRADGGATGSHETAGARVLIVLAPMDLPARTLAIAETKRLLRQLSGHGVAVQLIDGPRVIRPATTDMGEAERTLDRNVASLRNPGPRDALDPSWPLATRQSVLDLASGGGPKAMVYFLEADLRNAGELFERAALQADVAIYPVFVRDLEVAVPPETTSSDPGSAWSNTLPTEGVPMRDFGARASSSFSEWSRQRGQLERLAKATGGQVVRGDTRGIVERISGRHLHESGCPLSSPRD